MNDKTQKEEKQKQVNVLHFSQEMSQIMNHLSK